MGKGHKDKQFNDTFIMIFKPIKPLRVAEN